MGLSASQARYLQLTARKNDYEYRAQQINNSRLQLADKMEEISRNYSDGISNRRMMFTSYSEETGDKQVLRLSYDVITAEAPKGLGYKLVNANGTEIRPESKNSSSIRKSAESKYAEAQEFDKAFFTTTKDNQGNDVKTKVTGENFLSLFEDDNVFKGDTLVDKKSFGQIISKMSAVEFCKFWNSNGYSFASNTTLATDKDNDYLDAARKEYEEQIAEANKVDASRSIFDDRCLDSSFLEEKLRSGEWMLQKVDENNVDEFGNAAMKNVYFSSDSRISDELDTSDDARVNAEYQEKMDFYSHKDKELELELQQVETSHSALDTELDSVKKVIEKNVEKSFKTFG